MVKNLLKKMREKIFLSWKFFWNNSFLEAVVPANQVGSVFIIILSQSLIFTAVIDNRKQNYEREKHFPQTNGITLTRIVWKSHDHDFW